MVTGAVTAELLDRVDDVALNVHADNEPAVAAYTRLGYRSHCELIERLVRRHAGGWGLIRPIREAMRSVATRVEIRAADVADLARPMPAA